MNYQKIYNNLITRAIYRNKIGYCEKHHILPKCLGGTNEKYNLVNLTPEEHFLAHILLIKIYPHQKNLILAVQKMTQGHRNRRTKRRLYGWLKRKHQKYISEIQSGEKNSQFGSFWISNGTQSRKCRGKIPEGWWKGRNRAEPKKINHSTYKSKWINNGKENKILYRWENMPEGWNLGRLNCIINKKTA